MSLDFLAMVVAILLMSAFLLTHWRQILAFLSTISVALFLLGVMDVIDGLHLFR